MVENEQTHQAFSGDLEAVHFAAVVFDFTYPRTFGFSSGEGRLLICAYVIRYNRSSPYEYCVSDAPPELISDNSFQTEQKDMAGKQLFSCGCDLLQPISQSNRHLESMMYLANGSLLKLSCEYMKLPH